MRLIGYARVSTVGQDYDAQLEAIDRFASQGNHDLVATFQEKESGAKMRPELTAAMAAMKDADALVVTKLDRVSRSLPDLLELIKKLDADGKALICLDQSIDTSSKDPLSRAIVQILGVIAEFERALIFERISEGRARAKAAGKRLGPGPKELPKDLILLWRSRGYSVAHVSRELIKKPYGIKVSSRTLARRLKEWKT